jgi:uridylate kinase
MEAMTSEPRQRVLLKLSGELLAGAGGEPLDPAGLTLVADQIEAARSRGAQVGVVLGGGNILRGARGRGEQFDRAAADAIGMVATLVNVLAVQAELDRRNVRSHVLNSFAVPRVADLHTARRARELLDRGEVVLFGGGTGNPYFTTDTTAALRALESGCTVLIKATKVDGVYSADPERDPAAVRYASLTYEEVLERKLGVMDLTAITLCMENRLRVVVLNARQEGSVRRFLAGESVGTVIRPAGAADPGR